MIPRCVPQTTFDLAALGKALPASPKQTHHSKSAERRALLQAEQDKRVTEVDSHFQGMTVLAALQEMCMHLFGTTPGTKTQCKALLSTVFIHIYDYVRECKVPAAQRNFRQHFHASVSRLRAYCTKIGTYPRERAKKEGVVKALLRRLY